MDGEYANGRVTVMTDEEIVACVERICRERNLQTLQRP